VAKLTQLFGMLNADTTLKVGEEAAFAQGAGTGKAEA
jgi:hypothetical protein